ncbi:MAG: toxin [Gammaproteobacteria bacterium]
MKRIEWDEEKNKQLITQRGLSFEAITVAIEEDKILDILPHSNPQYEHQYIFVLDIQDYVVYVPFVEDEEKIFLKIAFHNRKATRDYLRDKK